MIRPQVLSVDSDFRLLLARHTRLEDGGFAVTSVGTTFEGLKTLMLQRYAAVVLGYTLTFTEKQLFAAEVGERWRIPVIALYEGNADFQFTADDRVEITAGAEELIAILDELIDPQQRQTA
jgi:DNA-binding response OmpR family regulator